MKSKKLLTVFIVLIFAAILLFGIFSVFTIRKINAEFDVSDNASEYSTELVEKLNGFVGKNILFTDTEEVAAVLAEYPYLKIEVLKKSYPNAITVSVKERAETYKIYDGTDYYILDESGFIVAKNNAFGNKFVELKGLTVIETKVGAYLVAEQAELLSVAYNAVGIASYSNNIESAEIVLDIEKSDIVLYMRTGVKITVLKATDGGAEKMQKAFDVYDGMDDYHKSERDLLVYKNDLGEIEAVWTTHQ